MKKLSFFITAATALFMSINSFAGDTNLPKAEPANEMAITVNTPNEDPSAPPPPTTYTYFTIVWRNASTITPDPFTGSITPSTNELNALPAYSYDPATWSTVSKTSAGFSAGSVLMTVDATCAQQLLNQTMCGHCSTWGRFFQLGTIVTTNQSLLTMACP